MTTGEKLAALRREKGITQEQLAELVHVSRQSVSRWEMDAAFPETEKLIKLSHLLACSIDFLLNNDMQRLTDEPNAPTADRCFQFIRECGFFFLATSVQGRPRLRPMGMILSNGSALFFATDRRKSVYGDLMVNPQVELGSYNINTSKWLRISGRVAEDTDSGVREQMLALYPMIRQEFAAKNELNFVIFRLSPEHVTLT